MQYSRHNSESRIHRVLKEGIGSDLTLRLYKQIVGREELVQREQLLISPHATSCLIQESVFVLPSRRIRFLQEEILQLALRSRNLITT